VPRRLVHPKRKTIGVRVPGHPVAHALLAELDEPMLSATLILPGDELPLSDAQEIRRRLEHELDLVIDAGSCGTEPSTVIDLTGDAPVVLRKGKGSLAPFAVEAV
jgi:tRNA threonylcarbamoyl adenosine modification protein (Sua5/YciO/YrdC/YwlC family)